MSTQRRGVALTPMETRYDIILRTAQLADELGYEAFALPEGWGLDATLLLTEAASRTRRIKLVSGILSVWGRTPGTLAMTAATLHRLSGGRFVLGLGPSTRALVEGFHDVRFVHPADKLRDTTIKVRALLAGERALLDATPGSRPLRLGQPAAPDLRIWLAAMGDRTVRVAAELADGWFPLFVARDQVLDRVHTLRKDREAAALRTEPLTVVAGPMTIATDDAAVARRISASCVAWYLSAMGDVYARFVTEQGYGSAVQVILEANPHPRPDGGVVPAEAQVVLDQFTRPRYAKPGPRSAGGVERRGRRGDDRAATGPALGHHRGNPPGRCARRTIWKASQVTGSNMLFDFLRKPDGNAVRRCAILVGPVEKLDQESWKPVQSKLSTIGTSTTSTSPTRRHRLPVRSPTQSGGL